MGSNGFKWVQMGLNGFSSADRYLKVAIMILAQQISLHVAVSVHVKIKTLLGGPKPTVRLKPKQTQYSESAPEN